MKKAFTLMELIIAILILSLLMLFLYKSYSNLNKSNRVYSRLVDHLTTVEHIRKTLYLDLSMATRESIIIEHIDKQYDFISFETKNSLHKRINPYVCYLIKENILYRLESLIQITSTEISRDIEFDIDKVTNVKKLKLFTTRDKKRELYLLDLRLKETQKMLLKVKVLN